VTSVRSAGNESGFLCVRLLPVSGEDERRAIVGEIDTSGARSHYDALDRRLLVARRDEDKTVAILETRMGDHIASLVRKYGGRPFSAPALAEIPDVDPAHINELIRDWNSAPPDIFIFKTGVGLVSCGALVKFVLVREGLVNHTELTDDNGRPISIG